MGSDGKGFANGSLCWLEDPSVSARTPESSFLPSDEDEDCTVVDSVELPLDDEGVAFENVVFVLLVEVVGVDFETLKARLLNDMLHGWSLGCVSFRYD